MNDDGFEEELEALRRRRLEELSKANRSDNKEESKMNEAGADWPDKPVNITDSNFKEFIAKYPYVIVDFWAPWCGPCKMLGPVIEELAGDYKGKVVFAKLNTDENQMTAMSLGIMSIPTLIFYKDGQMVDKTMGAVPKPMLEPKVQEHL